VTPHLDQEATVVSHVRTLTVESRGERITWYSALPT
jgi:hypothetical protein